MERMTVKAVATATEVGWFTALAAVFGNVDRDGDRIVKGAFAQSIEAWQDTGRTVPLHWNHSADPDDIIGHIDPRSMVETDRGLVVEGQLDLEGSDRARKAWRAMKTGSIGLSFGYLAQRQRKAGDGANELLAIDLFEISLTPGPSNSATAVLSMKSAHNLDRVREEAAQSMYELLTSIDLDAKALELEREADRADPDRLVRVLAMSELLPQPHGLEGFGFSPVVAPPDALPVTPLGGTPERLVKRRVATRAAATHAHGCERQVAEVAHCDDLDDHIGQEIDQVLPPAPDSIVAVKAALDRDHAREGLHVSVHQSQKGTQVASVEGVIGLASQLHVLLRHRSPSMPATRSRASRVEMPTRLRSLVDHRAHLVTRERPHRLRADVSLGADGQQRCGSRLVVRCLDHGYDVVLSEGPIDIGEPDAELLELLLGGFIAIDGVLEVRDSLLGPVDQRHIPGHPTFSPRGDLVALMSLGQRSDGFQSRSEPKSASDAQGEGHDRRGAIAETAE
jgi:HK97 family phage prohead protease